MSHLCDISTEALEIFIPRLAIHRHLASKLANFIPASKNIQ